MAIINFQVNTEEQATTFDDFSPIPAGKYKVVAESIELGQTKSGTGEYLKCQFRVCPDQPFHNRIIWTYINIKNTNETAERIGRSQLSQLLLATGKQFIRDTDELLSIPVMAQVGIRPASGDYSATNTIKGFEKVAGAGGGIQNPAVKQVQNYNNAPVATPTQQQTNNPPPWAMQNTEAPFPDANGNNDVIPF